MAITRPEIPNRDEFMLKDGQPSLAAMIYLSELPKIIFPLLEAGLIGHDNCFIETPEAKTYKIIPDAKFEFEINETTTQSGSGTATVTWSIDGVALGGTANAASTVKQTKEHTTDNIVSVGSYVSLTVSAITDLLDLSTGFKYTRLI